MFFHFWLRLIFDVKLALQILHLELFFSSWIWFYVCIQACPSCKFNSANTALKVFSFMNCLCKACIANITIERLFPHELIVCVHVNFSFMLYTCYKKWYSFKVHFENENIFIFKMGFEMSFCFQNVVLLRNVFSFSKCERFRERFFSFSKKHNCEQKSVNKNLYSHYKLLYWWGCKIATKYI